MPLQEWIHTLEEGAGVKFMRIFLAVVAFVAIAVAYDYFCFKNFRLPEAMDSAQLARNLSEGKGYTTDYARPLDIYLLKEHGAENSAIFKKPLPDLANAPVYPALLAAWFKVTPVQFDIDPKGTFFTYQPERWIAVLNQILCFCVVLQVFFLARRLFSPAVGWLSALVLAGTELIWRFSVSGLSTMLLMALVLGVVFCLVKMDERQREETVQTKKILGVTVLAGVLIGLAGLTQYSFLWLILPSLAFVALFTPFYRIKVAFVLLFSFLIVVTPWLVRNKMVSGALFGTATYAAFSQTTEFPDHKLERSLNPDFDKVTIKVLGQKLFINLRDFVANQIPKLGGSWVTAFFLVGLLMPFRSPIASRLRLFLIFSLIVFLVVQSLARTSAAHVSGDVTADNLLIVFVPLVLMMGAAVGVSLIRQIEIIHPAKLEICSAIFLVIVSAPLILALLPPGSYPSAYPPYHPPLIQKFSYLMKTNEMLMSDVPASVAWYGDRQCVALTLDRGDDFYAINDDIKPIHALYLSPRTTDGRLLTDIAEPKSWEQFVFQIALRGDKSLAGFPLKSIRRELMPHHLLLMDWERWKMPGDS